MLAADGRHRWSRWLLLLAGWLAGSNYFDNTKGISWRRSTSETPQRCSIEALSTAPTTGPSYNTQAVSLIKWTTCVRCGVVAAQSSGVSVVSNVATTVRSFVGLAESAVVASTCFHLSFYVVCHAVLAVVCCWCPVVVVVVFLVLVLGLLSPTHNLRRSSFDIAPRSHRSGMVEDAFATTNDIQFVSPAAAEQHKTIKARVRSCGYHRPTIQPTNQGLLLFVAVRRRCGD